MAPMLELHNIDVQSFLSVLDTCEGDVYIICSKPEDETRLFRFNLLGDMGDAKKPEDKKDEK